MKATDISFLIGTSAVAFLAEKHGTSTDAVSQALADGHESLTAQFDQLVRAAAKEACMLLAHGKIKII